MGRFLETSLQGEEITHLSDILYTLVRYVCVFFVFILPAAIKDDVDKSGGKEEEEDENTSGFFMGLAYESLLKTGRVGGMSWVSLAEINSMPSICSVHVMYICLQLSALVYLHSEVKELKELLVRKRQYKTCSLQK